MEAKDPKNSVHNENEQFRNEPEKEKENTHNPDIPRDDRPEEKSEVNDEKNNSTSNEENTSADKKDKSEKSPEEQSKSRNISETDSKQDLTGDEEEQGKKDAGDKQQEQSEYQSQPEDPEKVRTGRKIESKSGEKQDELETGSRSQDQKTSPDGETARESESSPKDEGKQTDKTEESESLKPPAKKEEINYNLLSKSDLLEILKELLDEGRIRDIGKDVAAIKSSFYKQHRAEIEEKKVRFLKEGGNEQDFSPGESEEEQSLKELLKKYSDLRAEYNKLREEEKDENLKKKHQIIDEIKELANRDEAINITFQEFRDLQRRWHEVGAVPQGELKNLWETYHYYVEKFYDYIKINKELRDLDLKKNLEAKIKLCEQAEELILEPNIVNAFKTLQKYHDQWREIGPVPREKRTELWERFKEATSKINKKHQQYYHELKENQKKNLESKKVLCEKAEALADMEIEDHSTWVEKTREILDIQKVWKTIGFAPKKDNNKIYARFRAACDKFFNKKREYYARGLEEQQENLQKKMDLCIQAEALKDSTDWKKTTGELIDLQKQWKKIGPVPRKKSDAIWKRFRSACDHFFDRKSDFFSNIEEKYEENLKKKEKLIEEIKNFEPGESQKENLAKLNEFQKRWTDIGFVPFEKKDEIMQEYRDVINKKYDQLDMDDHRKNVLKFKNKLESIKNKPRPDNKLRFEREKLMNKLQQLKNDIVLWENNIGFFTESKNADSMIKDFQKKIENARKKIKLLEDKIIMIDESEEGQ